MPKVSGGNSGMTGAGPCASISLVGFQQGGFLVSERDSRVTKGARVSVSGGGSEDSAQAFLVSPLRS